MNEISLKVLQENSSHAVGAYENFPTNLTLRRREHPLAMMDYPGLLQRLAPIPMGANEGLHRGNVIGQYGAALFTLEQVFQVHR